MFQHLIRLRLQKSYQKLGIVETFLSGYMVFFEEVLSGRY